MTTLADLKQFLGAMLQVLPALLIAQSLVFVVESRYAGALDTLKSAAEQRLRENIHLHMQITIQSEGHLLTLPPHGDRRTAFENRTKKVIDAAESMIKAERDIIALIEKNKEPHHKDFRRLYNGFQLNFALALLSGTIGMTFAAAGLFEAQPISTTWAALISGISMFILLMTLVQGLWGIHSRSFGNSRISEWVDLGIHLLLGGTVIAGFLYFIGVDFDFFSLITP